MEAGNKKNIMRSLIAFIIAMFVFNTACYCADISVVIDDKVLEFDTAPIIYNDRTMVPMRKIFEQLGCGVEWLGEKSTIIATKNNLLIAMQIGSSKVIKTDIETGTTEVLESDTAPVIHNDRTMIPVRVISEALGYNVLWDANESAVIINTASEKEN